MVWIDFENAPHVWVFSPIIERLRANCHECILTARDFSYTVPLARQLGLEVDVVGGGREARTRSRKVLRTLERAARLCAHVGGRRRELAIALSHSSRAQTLAATVLGIPVVALDDYEFADHALLRFVDHVLAPAVISTERWGRHADRIVHYPGLKEELYLAGFRPPATPAPELPLDGSVRVLFRPGGRFTHYQSPQTEVLQRAALQSLREQEGVFLVLMPRDPVQGEELAAFCDDSRIPHWTPPRVVDGPDLVWQMDLVLGGGGTMTREAALLGVPAYSFFGGRLGSVDRHLVSTGRLTHLARVDDLLKVRYVKRDRAAPIPARADGLEFVARWLEQMLAAH